MYYMCALVRVWLLPRDTMTTAIFVKGNILLGLEFLRFSPLWWETWQHPGRYGSGRTESSTSSSEAKQKTGFQTVRMRVLKPTPTVTHSLQQGHTISHKATSPNSAISWAKHTQSTTPVLLDIYVDLHPQMWLAIHLTSLESEGGCWKSLPSNYALFFSVGRILHGRGHRQQIDESAYKRHS